MSLPSVDIEALARGVLAGERRALARAITLIESSRARFSKAARSSDTAAAAALTMGLAAGLAAGFWGEAGLGAGAWGFFCATFGPALGAGAGLAAALFAGFFLAKGAWLFDGMDLVFKQRAGLAPSLRGLKTFRYTDFQVKN